MPSPGDIAVTATAGNLFNRIAAATISWFTAEKVDGKWVKSSVNHAFGYKGDGKIIEADQKDKESDISEYPNDVWITLPPELTPNDEQRAAIVEFWESKIGKKYNWIDLLAIGLAQKRFGNSLHRLSKTWWVKRLSKDNRYICSQLMDAGYENVGIHLFTDGRPEGLVSPQD